MSRKRYECRDGQGNTSFLGKGNCCCDFPTLIILILIILQFTRRGYWGYPMATAVANADGCGEGAAVAPATGLGGWFGGAFQQIDNSILFIIALFFLSCCNPCKNKYQ